MTEMKKKTKIIPNSERVIIQILLQDQLPTGQILMPGQLKAGENLYAGTVVHPGDTKFKVGQVIYYSEYSAAALYDLGAVKRGEMTMGDAIQNRLFVIAADDIMAYEPMEQGV